ncbi:MFS transporter [Paenibacillus selenitireducens]|uniref:MFS transporter n=1 Tax=Paenibacillus selenitireducens TaxID=1324314 RepID=A0A1T2XHA0_9BACL|nr:MFS transporter [Paenibacillus selenitireducens]OPA79269.1 MFS transporter [Paenibacillus selenitireducens]
MTAKAETNTKIASKPKSIWLHPNFLVLFLVSGIITFGNRIYELALPLILYELTESSVTMSTMRGIEFLPNLLLAMFIGVMVDRVHKKRWSLGSILLQILVLLALFTAIQFGHPSIFVFYIAGFFLMTFGYAFSNARVSMVKQALPKEMLTSANASFNFITTLIGIMGPVITGLILMLPKLHEGLFITAIAFIFAFVILLFLKSEEIPVTSQRAGFWRELGEGWRELRSNRPLWLITITVIFLNSTAGMVDTTIIFLAKDTLRLQNYELGLVLSMAGVGGLLGSFVISWFRRKFRVGVLIAWTTLIVGITYLMMFFAHSAILLGMSLFFNGFFETISIVSIWTFRQETTPHQLIGRISGITGSLFKLGMPFAIMGAGWISQLADPSMVFAIACVGNILIFFGCRHSTLWTK